MPGLRFAGRARTHAAPPSTETLRFGRSWVRLSPWRGDPRIAHLVTASASPLAAGSIAQCLDRLRALGYQSVLTNAMAEPERQPFLAQGFTVREDLLLLSCALDAEPEISTSVRVDAVGRHEHALVVVLDAAAFTPFWRLGPLGLSDALDATPRCQFRASRAVTGRTRSLAGYAITGTAGGDGYLQRVAVDPVEQGQGHGRALVEDALHFLWREGAGRAYVNTQVGNDRAIALYESCGFAQRPDGLAVLERSL